jgi:hypothetical protein
MSIGNEYPNEPFTRCRHQRTRLPSESKPVTLTYQEARLEVDHKDATMSRGTRVSMAVCTGLAALGLVACGDKTATVQITAAGGSVSLVITGSADKIAAFESFAAGLGAALGPAGAPASASTVDGDQHQGALVCETDITENGDKLHVAIYSASPGAPSTLCSQLGNGASP